MSLTHCIRTLLDLKDKNISFPENYCEERVIKGRKTKLIYATLTYKPVCCTRCGCLNTQFSIVKNGFLTSNIKWISTTHFPTYLVLKKQRFLCRECHCSFLAESTEIAKHCFISNRVKQSIAFELEDNSSRKDIAKRHFISDTTVLRVLVARGKSCLNGFDSLPAHLCFDEFKSVKRVEGKMSFIYCDAITHGLIDILPDRKLVTLRAHFLRYSLKERSKVQSIVVDMNAGYFTLAKELFPNANVIIDRFHLVQLLTVALNKTRIQVMNQFKRWKPEEMKDYRKLKRYWKLLLQDSQKVNYTDYQYHRLFRKVMPHSEIVDYLLSLNSTLKATYTCYQDLLYAMSQNNSDLLKSVLSSPHEQVSDYMSTALQTLRKHEERIRNTFQSKRSNGPLEGSINKIKVIKRTAYGYTSFLNYKYRILISFQEKEKTI
ncbi:ISL3 family transposase [Carnobacterium maltaromaticum]|jgi:transposase|uniref:ISL3 family transposase n=6 Tax=Carnobacterium maltaromaticum TaxID=2751 RepID=UPI000E7494AC|nr:ISL3 family transposase [Carnobacterium maltaromaticum]AOA02783.1 hypothetical protein BFC23_09875 [Carnobacterium maltaromaticum]MCI1819292.1 ISL3 family transposase [Carnobacterium maltaromaticum]